MPGHVLLDAAEDVLQHSEHGVVGLNRVPQDVVDHDGSPFHVRQDHRIQNKPDS